MCLKSSNQMKRNSWFSPQSHFPFYLATPISTDLSSNTVLFSSYYRKQSITKQKSSVQLVAEKITDHDYMHKQLTTDFE